jgi:hypothetical protein
MRNNSKLYFDIWRKANFRELLRAYVKSYELYPKEEIARGFAEQLDIYSQTGRGTYTGNRDGWQTAYTISRELGVYKDTQGLHFELSSLAVCFLDSKITASQYLANYLLNFNQLIQGQVIHPLKKVLDLFVGDIVEIHKDSISSITEFNLDAASEANKRQMVNIFCNRAIEAGIFAIGSSRDFLTMGSYRIQDLQNSCNLWEDTANSFEQLDHNGYVDFISIPNRLVFI